MAGLAAALRPVVDSGDVPGLVAAVARGDDVEVVALGVLLARAAGQRHDRLLGERVLAPLGMVDTAPRAPWNVIGRYRWVGGTGTGTYVDLVHDVVSVILTQVELGGPGAVAVLEASWAVVA